MVWKILRPYYWILDRKVRTMNRLVVVVLFLLLVFGGQWIYDNLIREKLALLNSEQAVTAIASFLPLGLFVVLLFALLGVGDVMHQLFLTLDLELLMIAPVPFRTIFLVKLLQCSRATLIPALGAGAFLMVLGLAREARVNYYVLVVLLSLAAMTLAAAVVMILVILLARFLPVQKTRSWMPVMIALATLVLMLGQQWGAQWFLGHTGLITFLAEALLYPAKLSLVVLVFGGLSVATSLAAYRIFDTSFHEGWNRFREVPTRQVPDAPVTRRSWGLSRLVQPLPAPLRFFLVKEWLDFRRNPRGLISLAQPLVLVVVVLVPFMGGAKGSETLRPLIFWFILWFLALFLSTLPIGTSLMAIAREGRRMALLRSAPISMSVVLRGKFWATWVPTVSSWVLVFLAAGLWLQYPPWQIGFLVGMTIWGLAGASVATVAIGGLKVDFTAEEQKQRISTVTSYLVMGLNLVFGLLTITSAVWLIIRFFPDSREIQVIRALAGYGAVGWLFSDKLWIPLGLVSSQVVFWVGVRLLWDAAVRRLEGWEES